MNDMEGSWKEGRAAGIEQVAEEHGGEVSS